jgi:hypothetical protein
VEIRVSGPPAGKVPKEHKERIIPVKRAAGEEILKDIIANNTKDVNGYAQPYYRLIAIFDRNENQQAEQRTASHKKAMSQKVPGIHVIGVKLLANTIAFPAKVIHQADYKKAPQTNSMSVICLTVGFLVGCVVFMVPSIALKAVL